jgi:hypothetical protein
MQRLAVFGPDNLRAVVRHITCGGTRFPFQTLVVRRLSLSRWKLRLQASSKSLTKVFRCGLPAIFLCALDTFTGQLVVSVKRRLRALV